MAKTGWNNLLVGINRAMECAMRLSDSDDAGKNFIFELGRNVDADGIGMVSLEVEEASIDVSSICLGLSNSKVKYYDNYEYILKSLFIIDEKLAVKLASNNTVHINFASEKKKISQELSNSIIKELYIRPNIHEGKLCSAVFVINPSNKPSSSVIDEFLCAVSNVYGAFGKMNQLSTERKDDVELESLSRLASIYLIMYLIDIQDNTYTTISTIPTIEALFKPEYSHDAGRQMTNIMNNIADETFLDDITAFTDLLTLPLRLYGKNTIDREYVSKLNGYCRARFIVYSYDRMGSVKKVLFAVENIDEEKKKENRLLYLSETDLMTGIRNRGSGEAKVRALMKEGIGGMMCLLDVDKFKKINDTYGHDAGDQVLIDLARYIKMSFNNDDVVLRLGGDEFSVYSPNINNKKAAKKVIDNLFEAVSHIRIGGVDDSRVTVSLGAVFVEDDSDITFETVYHMADECMYKSKAADTSKCTFYDEL